MRPLAREHTVNSDPSRNLWSHPQRIRLYSSSQNTQRARRANDLLLLLGTALGIAVLLQIAQPPSGFERALIEVAASVPAFVDIVWRVLAGTLLVWAATLVVTSIVRWRLDILRDIALSCSAATVLAVVLGRNFLGGGLSGLWTEIMSTSAPAAAVSLRLAIVAAATVVASPYIARTFRSTSRWTVGLGALALVMLDATTPSGAVIGLLCGAATAMVVHLALGSSGGRPGLHEVREALSELGVQTDELSAAQRQTAGVHLVYGRDDSGAPLLVKVYGRDAWDTQLLAKTWRALWYRDSSAFTLTRLQQAEHEAFVTLLAARNGVHVNDVVKAGRTSGNDALIVLHHEGTPIANVPATQRPTALASMWVGVLALQQADIAHGALTPALFAIQDGRVLLSGFQDATVSPTGDALQIDLAQLVVTTVLLFGLDDALAEAVDRIGPERLATVVPYLQVAALGRRLRAEVKAADLDLDDVRKRAALVAGIEAPTMARLVRASRGTLFRAALLSVAGYVLISQLAGIDFAGLADALRGATLSILLIGLLLGQAPRLAYAVSTRGACPRPVAFGPLALLQFAITFVNLLVPSAAGRIAANIRFFQRQGIPPASAVSIGLIDSVAGFAVQMTIVAGVLLFGFANMDLHLERNGKLVGGHILQLLAVLALLVVLAVIVVLVVPSLRRRIVEQIQPWIGELRDTLRNLRSPTKLAQVLGGNLLAEVLFASTLGLVLTAFHTSLPLGTLLLINVCVSVFAGLMPVPGGVGVSEGALVAGLTAAGVDQTTAFAVAITYRLITYYLPPIWGSIALRRLRRDGLL